MPGALSQQSLPRRTVRLLAVTSPSFAGRGAQFLALVLLASAVTPDRYGAFVVIQTLLIGVASVLGSTTAVRINAATARVPRAAEFSGAILLATMTVGRRWMFLAGAVTSAAITPLGYTVIIGERLGTGTLVVLVAAGILGGALPVMDSYVAVLAGSGRYLRASWTDAIRALVGAASATVATALWGAAVGGLGLVAADALILLVLALRATVDRTARPVVPALLAEYERQGTAHGIIANVIGQLTAWIVLLGVQLVAGPSGVGVYGVATRFASLVTLVPVYLGKTIVGQLVTPSERADGRAGWTGRSFLGMLAVVSVVGAGASFVTMLTAFPGLTARYDGLIGVTAVVLVGTVFRALLIGSGYLCVARRRWRTWVVADAASLGVTVIGAAMSIAAGGTVASIAVVAALATAIGLGCRLIGLSSVASASVERVA